MEKLQKSHSKNISAVAKLAGHLVAAGALIGAGAVAGNALKNTGTAEAQSSRADAIENSIKAHKLLDVFRGSVWQKLPSGNVTGETALVVPYPIIEEKGGPKGLDPATSPDYFRYFSVATSPEGEPTVTEITYDAASTSVTPTIGKPGQSPVVRGMIVPYHDGSSYDIIAANQISGGMNASEGISLGHAFTTPTSG